MSGGREGRSSARDRRDFCVGALSASLLACLGVPAQASALGRVPMGGRVRLSLPWPTASIDPHDARDPAAALFGPAIADPLFALIGAGVYPTLAAGMPNREGSASIVRLREGLRSGRGAPLDARDLIASVERARGRGASPLLASVPRPELVRGDRLAASFPGAEPEPLARLLASPMLALLPRRFRPEAPDGTGAFVAEPGATRLLLQRNPNAARGPAFLEAIEVDRAPDLQTSLRAFEAERDDVGWLGLGLHTERRGALRFDLGAVGWVVLAAGRAAPAGLGRPGAAQRLCDALPAGRLAHLGLGALPPGSGAAAWAGPSFDLLVDASAPALVECARVVASILSRPDHEVTPRPIPRAELARRRARDAEAVALDFARPLGPSALHALISLASLDDPARARDLARHPPRLAASASARSLTGTLRVGVLGEVRVFGGRIAELELASAPAGQGWDLGASFLRSARLR